MSEKEQDIQRILLFRQLTKEAPITYAISPLGISDETVGSADAADSVHPQLKLGGKSWKLDLTAGGDGAQESAQVLDESGSVIGNIVPWSRGSRSILALSESYDYRVLTLVDQVLFVYEIGMGAEGHYWCIYENDETLVAMIRKSTVTKDSLDMYELYMERVDLALPVCLLALYIDATAYARVDENGFNRENLVTTARGLLRKFNPNFIQKLRASLDVDGSSKPAW